MKVTELFEAKSFHARLVDFLPTLKAKLYLDARPEVYTALKHSVEIPIPAGTMKADDLELLELSAKKLLENKFKVQFKADVFLSKYVKEGPFKVLKVKKREEYADKFIPANHFLVLRTDIQQ